MKFRKKPVVIEAQRFDGTQQEACRLRDWVGAGAIAQRWTGSEFWCLDIPTMEGTMRAGAGDWVIRGVKGEFYPCKPDIFEATYDLVEEPALT